jgi:hypothetical protein
MTIFPLGISRFPEFIALYSPLEAPLSLRQTGEFE